ncbi:helix-turn-helix transcriptional regulator [Streptomyces sp. NPDC049954]|uniref:helix-turn-helix domain-containing protein n=1 Tax=Streptomyces sp. NPDC049954 TaxID=3155779 RepID=UPI00343B5839
MPTAGELLRLWRGERRISQLELALRAGSSARHLSFVETGRARPGEDLLARLAEQLDLPIRERNTLFVAAGYAPVYPQTPLDAEEMAALGETLAGLLRAHEPHPALVVDGAYDVVAANRGVRFLLGELPPELATAPLNAIRLTLHPRGLAPRIRNLPEWRAHFLHRVERHLSLGAHPRLRAVYEEVLRYPVPGAEEGWEAPGPRAPQARAPYPYALPLRIEAGGRELTFLSTATTFNTPLDVTVSELAVETFLPADRRTAEALREALGPAWPDWERDPLHPAAPDGVPGEDGG